jgi:KipI family sensor histidine kinase inhibitor
MAPAGIRVPRPRIDPVGDAALLVTLGDELDLELNALARRLAARLGPRGAPLPGLGVPVAGHASVLVPFDPDMADEVAVRTAIESAIAVALPVAAGDDRAPGSVEGRIHEVVVAYGGSDGPDLPEVARATGLSEREVVRLHASVEYRVLVVGFVPGFPYLGILSAALELPRRATPRVTVPAGSVAIAGRQAGIYPFATPGGWHLVGRTDTRPWDPSATEPALFAPGDRVRFVEA